MAVARDDRPAMTQDHVLSALDDLERALAANAERARMIRERLDYLRRERAKGLSYTEIVRAEEPPLIVQLVTESATALDTFGVRLRRLEAQTLYNEGLTMEQIAVLFGVTRQRVSALIKPSNG